MAYLYLTGETREPFVIPSLSPVSQPSSRKNSDYEVTKPELADLLLGHTSKKVTEEVLDDVQRLRLGVN